MNPDCNRTLGVVGKLLACLICAAGLCFISCKTQSPDDTRAIAISVDSLLRAGDTLSAISLGQQLLPGRSGFPSSNAGLADLLLALAKSFTATGHYEDAATLYENLLAQSSDSESISREKQIAILQEYGMLRSELGQDSSARVLVERSLAFRESLYSSMSWQYAVGLNALSVVESRAQSYTKADELLTRAISICRKAGQSGDSLLLVSLINFATVRAELADFAGERAAMEEAEKLAEVMPVRDPFSRSLVHNALSLYFDRAGDLGRGLQHQETSVLLVEQAFGPLHKTALLTRANLLVSYASLEDGESLRRELARLRDDLARVNIESPQIADACRISGSLYLNLDELHDAEALLRRALTLYDKLADPLSRDRADCLQALAQLEQKRGDDRVAIQYGLESLNIARNQFLDIFDNLAESEAYSYSRRLRDLSDFHLSLLREQPDSVFQNSREFARVVLAHKSIVTDGLMQRLVVNREIGGQHASNLLDSLAMLRSQLSRDPQRGGSAQLLTSIERIQRRIGELSSNYMEWRGFLDVSLDSVCARIPEGASLVEYYKYAHTNRRDELEARYCAIVLARSGLIRNIDLGSAGEIDRAAARWTDDMAAPQMLDPERYRRLAHQLSALIWKPVAPWIGESTLLLISPDAALNGIAFHALSDQGDSFLVERYAVHYLSAARDVLRLLDNAPAHQEPRMLALADPDYGLTRTDHVLQRLPHSRTEAERVSSQWRQHTKGTITMLLDTAASEAAFLRNCANADVIYIASHGDKGTVKDEIEHELLLAGQSLLLAADGSGETDGVLTAADITGLPLDHVRLVVLSACESAQGMQFEGEGAFSLRKAFQMAGVSTVISTLWQVDDPSTAELMSIVFVNDQSSIAVALQEAMNDRIRMLRGSGSPLGDHPYLWAGIVASGDWRFAQ